MGLDFLAPVNEKIVAHTQLLPEQTLGKSIKIHTKKRGIPALDGVQIAILGVHESRNASSLRPEILNIDEIRKQFYKLMFGNWNATIVDLGDIIAGAQVSDTYFVTTEIITSLRKKKITPIILGASQDITYPIYRAFDNSGRMVNITSIDSHFDFGSEEELISSHSYMSKIISDTPTNLFNFANIGYQSYFNAPDEIDLMEKLFFDAYRLGEITSDMSLAEPVLRDSDIVSLDFKSVKASEIGYSSHFSPNGFDGREVCALARYAGISDRVTVFGMFEMENNPQAAQLAAQVMWYFVEGYSFRANEFPFLDRSKLLKYIVPIDQHEDLCFFKSSTTKRWWIEVPTILDLYNKSKLPALLPCSHGDYLDACNQEIPERWLKAYKKSIS
ncbi:MAG: formimidoylglutamase [Flavobacteriaceae bacterium]|nr:formimidoylglutamase [Flavobacteriaceae bacterium]